MMNNPTDTNQAIELDSVFYNPEHTKIYNPSSKPTGVVMTDFDIYQAKQAIQNLIRAEKLKLLADVRERVVGEDERIDIQSEFDKIDVPHLETDRYPGLDGVRQASRNLCREHQRKVLTKLEAEL